MITGDFSRLFRSLISPAMSALEGVEALIFDVFGTVVDWRGSVTKDLEDLGRKYSLEGAPYYLARAARYSKL